MDRRSKGLRSTFKRDSALVVHSSRRVARSTTSYSNRATTPGVPFIKHGPTHRRTISRTLDMTTEEIEESQSVVEDGGVGGPGAPTPLSALEVSPNGLINPRTV